MDDAIHDIQVAATVLETLLCCQTLYCMEVDYFSALVFELRARPSTRANAVAMGQAMSERLVELGMKISHTLKTMQKLCDAVDM